VTSAAWLFRCERYPALQVRLASGVVHFGGGLYETTDAAEASALISFAQADGEIELVSKPTPPPVPTVDRKARPAVA
jgi:hypothetical protein